MKLTSPPRRIGRSRRQKKDSKRLHRFIENDLIRRVSYDEYRDKVQRVYGGPKGALLATCSMISLHIPLGKRIFRSRKFDLRGATRVLDVGSGAGQLASHVLQYCDPNASLVCTDLSHPMLRRARHRLANQQQADRAQPRKLRPEPWQGPQAGTPVASRQAAAGKTCGTQVPPQFVAADLSQLPFADGSFDCITCGYVLEHLPNPEPGLAEMARVLQPGGRMFLLTTEDSFSGAWTSRFWYCRTYNRAELMRICERYDLIWKQELWFTRMHQAFRAGGICVEIVKRG
jgi:ubiquinone/menaquinone biosynthesis C-methylase UbiE